MPMRRGDFAFRVSGADEHDLRRWRRRAEAGSATSGRTALSFVKTMSLVAILWVAPMLTTAEPPSIEQGGQTIVGGRVRMIQDGSSSMDAYAGVVTARLAALRAASAYSDLACRTRNTEFLDFVDCALREARGGAVDAFYVFADFQWAGITDHGVAQVRQALEQDGIRLYLETIGPEPDARLAALATSTGGAIIHTPK